MSKHAGRGHGRREAALERKAFKHNEFVGDADKDRAVQQNAGTVKEMARELEEAAGLRGDGAAGPEIPFRIPRSIEEGKRMVREAPEAMREKARERLSSLPEPARKYVDLVGTVAGFAMVPVRLGWNIARDLVRLPFAMFRALREREA